MSTSWGDAVWNERGELVVSIYKQPPEMKDNLNNKPKHTYKEIDCGGECGGCVALVVDGEVISGPPFHPNCKCSLSAADIESAPEQESNLGDTVGPGTYVSESTAWCWFEKHENDIIAIKDMLRKIGYEI